MRSFRRPASVLRSGELAVAAFLLSSAAWAGTVDVRVSDTAGKPPPGATITLIPSGRETVTGPDGHPLRARGPVRPAPLLRSR